MAPTIDRDTVADVARLARLHLEPSEAEGLARDLVQILDYVARLDSVPDAATAPPYAHGTHSGLEATNVLRSDIPTPESDPSAVVDAGALLALAPESDNGFYRVAHILGGDE